MDPIRRRTTVGLAVATLAACVVIGGCLVNARDDRPSSVILKPGNYTAQIEHAEALPDAAARRRALADLTAKPDLNEGDQLRILQVLLNTANAASANRDTLIELATHPAATPVTRQHVAIHARRLVEYPADRQAVLLPIAQRPDTGETEQLAIIETLLNSANTVTVNRMLLTTLASSPARTSRTRDAVRKSLDLLLPTDADRKAVSSALDAAPASPPAQ